VLVDTSREMPAVREAICGPVVTARPFEALDELIR